MQDLTPLPSPPERRVGNWRAAMELAWHHRRVDVYGTLVRVTVPMIGTAPWPGLDAQLSAVLGTMWTGRAPSPDVTVHSVVAEFGAADGGWELVLLVATDLSPYDHGIVNTRMIRDLRQALRVVRDSALTRSLELDEQAA